jgi:lipopolysaccharide biosynthesis regulator YciM
MFSILIFIPIIGAGIYFLYYRKLKPHKINNIREMYAEGLDMLVSGKRISAYKNFKKIIDEDSNNIKAYLKLGQILREGGNAVKALKIHNSLLLRKRMTTYERIELHKNIAMNYYSLDNLDKSILEAEKILKIEKDNEWAIHHLISLYKKNNDWMKATEYLKSYFNVIGNRDNHKLALYKIQHARIEIENNNFEQARNILEGALSIEDDLAIAYYYLGKTYSKDSSLIYDKAIELEKNGLNSITDKDKYNQYVTDAKDTLSKSIPMWIHYLEINPQQSWFVIPLLKDALFSLDRYSELEDIFYKLSEKFPDSIEILAALADYYSNKGNLNKAIDIIEKALSQNKDSILVKLIKFKLNIQKNSQNISLNDIDDIISFILKDTAYQMINDQSSNSDIKWLFNNDKDIS